jgi:orotate phosphoribosyltransferase
MTGMSERDVLDVLRSCGALLDGHFALRSGLHSDRFFQCANVLRYPRTAGRLCAALAAKLPDAADADAVISPALGGILVGHELGRALDVPAIFAEKEDGKLALRRFAIAPGTRFIIAEDVITRGGRVEEVIEIVTRHGGTVAAIALLVDRSGGKASFAYPTVSLLRMEPVTWAPEDCPLCRQGLPLVHPGS